MGKAITYLVILIFLDLFFIVTGQICSGTTECSISSIVFNALLDLGNLSLLGFMRQLFGDLFNFASSSTGVLSMLVGAIGVTLGAVITRSDALLFLGTAGIPLVIIGSDFTIIFRYLSSLNPVLAVIIMAPIMLMYVMVIVDWSRGKD